MKQTNAWHTILLATVMALWCGSVLAQAGGSGRRPYTPQEQEALNRYAAMTLSSIKLSNAGDAAVKQGNLKQAQDDYKQAVAQWPNNNMALYGLGDLEQKAGDTTDAVAHYRVAVYTHPGPPTLPTIREWNAEPLMKYVLLLCQAGQETEALTVYHHAADILNYEDGRPRRKVLLPDFGPDGLAYTPQHLQAMAHVGASIYTNNDQEELSHLQQAASLAPDVPAAHFYLGRFLAGHNKPGARAELERARQSGDPAIGAEVDRFEKTIP